MMKSTITTALAVAALFLGVASCGNNGPTATNNPPPVNLPGGSGNQPSVAYQQIERLATPALKEATENYEDHQSTNQTNPYVEAANGGALPTDATNFLTGPNSVAQRSSTYAGKIASLLFPDVVLVDLSQNATTAAYFGVQTGGATGNAFGGRALTDDAIDADLGLIFGNTLAKLGVTGDDGKESPCLTSDNVPGPNDKDGPTTVQAVGSMKNESSSFPYVGTPFTS